MYNKFLTDDLKANIGNITEVENLNLKFDEYKVVYFESENKDKIPGNEYIRGAKSFKMDEFHGQINNPNLLFSLLNLMKEPIPEASSEGYLDDMINTDKIIQWCRKYGLPLSDNDFRENYFEADRNKYYGFCTRIFRWEVMYLFSSFKLWEAITKKDIKNIYKYLFRTYISRDTLDKLKTPDEKISKAKEALAESINHNFHTDIRIFYNKDTDDFSLSPRDTSLISIAYYQLACFICTPEWARFKEEEGKSNIKICKNCLDYFLGHGNSVYCEKPECDRRKVYRKNKGKTIKGE